MIDTTINGRWTLKLPEHRAARPEWSNPGWEVMRLASMHANLRAGMCVYDVGAEEGDLPALWASWGCEVVLIEPNPRVWPNPKAIWEANQLPAPRACFVGFAADDDQQPDAGLTTVWPTCADGPLIGDHGFRTIPEHPDMPRIKIDTLAARVGPPHAITMDIEGAELVALRGAEATLKSWRPWLWISVHPTFMADTFKHRVTDLWDYLRSCGYTWRLLDYDHELHVIAWHERTAPTPELPW